MSGLGLAAVVGGGFGVDEEAGDLGGFALELAFELGDELVDARHGEVVGEGAVAGDLDEGLLGVGAGHAGDADVVDVDQARDGGGRVAEAELEGAVAIEGGGSLDSGGFALDVGEDGADLGDVAANVGLEVSDEVVGFAEGHGFGDLEVLLEMEAVGVLLEGEVVNGAVGAEGDGADAVVDGLGSAGGGNGVNDDVGAGEVALDGGGRSGSDRFRALEGEGAREGEGEVGEEAGAGLADADAVDAEDAVDAVEIAEEVAANVGAGAVGVMGGCGVEEGVDGLAGERPGDADDDDGDGDGGDRIGGLEAGRW